LRPGTAEVPASFALPSSFSESGSAQQPDQQIGGAVTSGLHAATRREGQIEKTAGNEESGDPRLSNLKMINKTCSK